MNPDWELTGFSDCLTAKSTNMHCDVIIIGGGQSGLAVAYFLKKAEVHFLILDANETPGGAWTHTWDSLKLFSPKEYSSLPGWMMPKTMDTYPTKEEIISYLSEYEKRYEFKVRRSTKVENVTFSDNVFHIQTSKGEFSSRALISATGNWSHPYIPDYPGIESFKGDQIHSAHYLNPEKFREKKVMVVGGGNSAAQILAEVSKVTKTIWVTKEPPEYLPDHVDGRYLFELATKKYQAMLKGETLKEAHDLAKIVMVDSVKDARERGVLTAYEPFQEIRGQTILWKDRQENVDSIIWCTGFRNDLSHLSSLNVINSAGKIDVANSRSIAKPALWLLGYGDWTGFAAATLIGIQRWAKLAAKEVCEFIE